MSEEKRFRYWREMSDEHKENLREKIAGTGLPAELAAHQLLQQHGYRSEHYYFNDPDLGKTRELDFAAFTGSYPHMAGQFGLYYCLLGEVKRHYTWVLLNEVSVDDAQVAARMQIPAWYNDVVMDLFPDVQDRTKGAEAEASVAGECLAPAHAFSSLHQYGTHKDAWYEAATKLVKAADSYRLPRVYEVGDSEGTIIADFYGVIPVVVLDGNLLIGRIVDGNLSLTECEHAIVRAPRVEDEELFSDAYYITVVTLGHFSAFLERAQRAEREVSAVVSDLWARAHTLRANRKSSE